MTSPSRSSGKTPPASSLEEFVRATGFFSTAGDRFEPYDRIQQPDPSTRLALRKIADRAVKKKQRAYIFVNNRLEGNAPTTIESVASDSS